MTALPQYERLEAMGLWRSDPADPGREVVVKFGKSTMVVEAVADEPLAHWSLPALRIIHEDAEGATYVPDFESTESLTVADPEMRMALARVVSARVTGRPPVRSRVPVAVATVLLAALIGAVVLSLPYTLSRVAPALIAPERARLLAGQMLPLVEARTGPVCESRAGAAALDRLARRLVPGGAARLLVADLGDLPYLALPGETVIISRHIAERAQNAEEFAGWAALALEGETGRAALGHVFGASRVRDGLGFLANGAFSDQTLNAAVSRLMLSADVRRPLRLEAATLLLADAGIPAAPLAAAIRREALTAGPLTIPPVEGSEGGPLVLSDGEWVALQGICEG